MLRPPQAMTCTQAARSIQQHQRMPGQIGNTLGGYGIAITSLINKRAGKCRGYRVPVASEGHINYQTLIWAEKNMRRKTKSIALIVTAAVATMVRTSVGVDTIINWNGPAGTPTDYNTAGLWISGAVPTGATQDAPINNSGSVLIIA